MLHRISPWGTDLGGAGKRSPGGQRAGRENSLPIMFTELHRIMTKRQDLASGNCLNHLGVDREGREGTWGPWGGMFL